MAALYQNSVCRLPCPPGSHPRGELMALYALCIRCSERSGDGLTPFATLVQLQEMLGLSEDEAVQIELEAAGSQASFSI
ncbi:hypothetical protein FOA52_010936 [Chlamydomonas sp. UWO 241]|nr:hypothetical protein FOA52_010936 [Chlamydomonas sp. UWO 241]